MYKFAKYTNRVIVILCVICLLISVCYHTFNLICPHYEFNKGDVLLPDYVHVDTLIVVKSFNVPDSLFTDGEINKYISKYTRKFK